MHIRFSIRIVLATAFAAAISLGQTPAPPEATKEAPTEISTELHADRSDPTVVRAQQNLDRVRALVTQGVLPPMNLTKAQDELDDALDQSILRKGAFNQNLSPNEADQMTTVAERIYLRRRRRAMQNDQLAASGVIPRAEAQTADLDVVSAKMDLDLATERAQLVKQMALQKALADIETEAEAHPEWNGKVYTRYDGNGTFTRADFEKISAAYFAAFGHAIPVSADGQTEVHKSMGLNHTGRIDIALSPEQHEGAWLLRYLEKNRIPYFAFKAAVAHRATGAHIHLGPGSARLASTPAAAKPCCGF